MGAGVAEMPEAVGGWEEACRDFSLGVRLDVAAGALARGSQVVAVVGTGAAASTTTDSPSEEIVPASTTISVSAGVSATAAEGRGGRWLDNYAGVAHQGRGGRACGYEGWVSGRTG